MSLSKIYESLFKEIVEYKHKDCIVSLYNLLTLLQGAIRAKESIAMVNAEAAKNKITMDYANELPISKEDFRWVFDE